MYENDYPGMWAALDVLKESLTGYTADYPAMFQNIAAVFSGYANSISKLMLDGYAQSLPQSIEILSSALEQLKETYGEAVLMALEITIPDETLRSVEKAIPYLEHTEENKEKISTLESITEHPKQKLTLSNAISILTLLITIFFGIMQQLPDEQLDRAIEQRDTQIELKRVELQAERELIDALNTIGDGIYYLADRVDALCEEAENTNEVPDPQRESNAENTEQENGDAQN